MTVTSIAWPKFVGDILAVANRSPGLLVPCEGTDRRGPKVPPVQLTADARQGLETLGRRHPTPQLALRARLILAAAGGLTNGQIAGQLGVDVLPARHLGLHPQPKRRNRAARRPSLRPDPDRGGFPGACTGPGGQRSECAPMMRLRK